MKIDNLIPVDDDSVTGRILWLMFWGIRWRNHSLAWFYCS